eukprot:CAMPEP_0119546916 /NCGR_PEP_ID=MMETSP1352-20130426/1150_1 /TAXON_ID=265584 /ORGANISM="Stauroneis constricta, Strain CCMP1120" /LENGTH=310 /DNA_ID=CAMNT_0007591681 /DNA_START=386 /DNA_END=1315 /DNA_ORIENTATION=-
MMMMRVLSQRQPPMLTSSTSTSTTFEDPSSSENHATSPAAAPLPCQQHQAGAMEMMVEEDFMIAHHPVLEPTPLLHDRAFVVLDKIGLDDFPLYSKAIDDDDMDMLRFALAPLRRSSVVTVVGHEDQHDGRGGQQQQRGGRRWLSGQTMMMASSAPAPADTSLRTRSTAANHSLWPSSFFLSPALAQEPSPQQQQEWQQRSQQEQATATTKTHSCGNCECSVRGGMEVGRRSGQPSYSSRYPNAAVARLTPPMKQTTTTSTTTATPAGKWRTQATRTTNTKTKPKPKLKKRRVYQVERWEGHFHHLLAFK